MKTFKVEINGHIKAENIDDAFAIVGRYYTGMSENGLDTESPFLTGEQRIYVEAPSNE